MPAPTKMSLIDRVDETDRAIGNVARGDVLRVGANFEQCTSSSSTGERLLLQHLAPTRERHPERWGSSVAAYLHAGESYEGGGTSPHIERASSVFTGKRPGR